MTTGEILIAFLAAIILLQLKDNGDTLIEIRNLLERCVTRDTDLYGITRCKVDWEDGDDEEFDDEDQEK